MRGKQAVLAGLCLIATNQLCAQSGAALSPAVQQYVSINAPTFALTHARVIDGTGDAAAEDQAVVVTNGRITAVGPTATVPVPAGAQVIDLTGKTLIPGLFGMHDHLFYPAGGTGGQRNHHQFSAPRMYLAAGVTSIRTAGTYEPYNDLNLKESIDEGSSPGPRINPSGAYLDATRGRVSSPEDARRLVNYWADEGATNFKAYTNIRKEELKAAIEEAHKRGLKVTGHLCSVTYQEAIEVGIDNLEHSWGPATDFDPNKKPDQCPPGAGRDKSTLEVGSEPVQALIRNLVMHNVAITTTPAVSECAIPGRPPLRKEFTESLSPVTLEARMQNRRRPYTVADSLRVERNEANARRFEKAFIKAGGHLQAGLDPTGSGCSLFGLGDQRNFELLVEGGFTPVETVKIMSYNGAKFLGQADSLGSIGVGKVADLVVLDGNLVQDPTAIERTTIVFKNGVGYDPAKLFSAVKGQVGIN
ncbi:MAG: amidohydrolase family protein [Gemmatimonadetes bacterium]|nr:amidohydrolase family protein [Gemmatimonadota bacterium]